MVKVENTLRNESPYGVPKQGDLTLLFDSEVQRGLPMTSLVGKLLLWACAWWRVDPGIFHVDTVYEPFNDQMFSNADVEDLKKQIEKESRTISIKQKYVQQYLENHWSKDRILAAYKIDNRANESNWDGTRIIEPSEREDKFTRSELTGRLYPGSNNALGEVTWYCEQMNGIPYHFVIYGRKMNKLWQLERGYFKLPGLSDSPAHP